MKKLVTILLFLVTISMLPGQGIKASFTIRFLPDNAWYLELKKDNTYKYLHWSGFRGNPTVLDSGTYSLENLKLITKSEIENNANGLKFNNYYIHKSKEISDPVRSLF